jgi:hypothetical protein
MLHEGAITLNCGRNALAYIIRARNIKNILLPKFLCDSVISICRKESVNIRYYSIGIDFLPKDLDVLEDEYLYLVNYYGQLTNEVIMKYCDCGRLIVDNAQAYFQEPITGIDTLYTCRKFFGVSDGAFLYSNCIKDSRYEEDESYDRLRFLLGRFERCASEFYMEYSCNNKMFADEPIKYMSKITKNLLHAIDYEKVKKVRSENFTKLHNEFCNINKLELNVPNGAFMYPLYVDNADIIRKELQSKKIYIPILWPDVFSICKENEIEYGMARNILPLPIDQRYDESDMEYLVSEIKILLR